MKKQTEKLDKNRNEYSKIEKTANNAKKFIIYFERISLAFITTKK